MSILDRFDLKKQFVFYASYHSQPVNVAIHLICIWPLLATALTLLQYTPDLIATPSCFSAIPLGSYAHVNGAFVVSAIYIIAYLAMEPVIGGIGGAMVATIYLFSGYLVQSGVLLIHDHPVWQVALVIHIVAWIIQFIGHGVFEKRAPALLDSLDQALLTAPLFVLMEVAFFFGYRKKFYDEIMKQVKANIVAFNSKPKSKKDKRKPSKH